MSPAEIWSSATRERLAAALREHAPITPGMEAHLRDAITDTAGRPGKLLRATLAYAGMRANGADAEASALLAAAIEFFHVASLLLDDLPCMDDAATRRGAVCVHRVHGEATAILSALGYINRAYALAGVAFAAQPGAVRLQAQACLDACLGTAGLLGGQARDLRFQASDRSRREISQIALGKTGAMLSLATVVPALLAKPSARERRALGALCIYWSLALQALDDVQDVLGSAVVAGKTTGRDRDLLRPNLALALGVPAARRRVGRLLRQAESAVGRLIVMRSAWSYLETFQRGFAESVAAVAVGENAQAA